jgi:hypothetical protein
VLRGTETSIPWLDLSGHLSDALLLSSVLKSYYDTYGRRVGIIRRPPLSALFVGHPAVDCIASHAPVEARVWWHAREDTLNDSEWQRAARSITEDEIPSIPFWAPCPDGQEVLASLPVHGRPLLIAPVPATPRGDWARGNWCQLIEEIRLLTDLPIATIAFPRVPGLPGTINLSGLHTPQELLGLVGASLGVIGVDPFVLRGSSMHGIPNIALLGPDWFDAAEQGQHLSVSGKKTCATPCYASAAGPAPCLEAQPCMSELSVTRVMDIFRNTLLPRLQGPD